MGSGDEGVGAGNELTVEDELGFGFLEQLGVAKGI
jgi:hypothetical protein